MKKTKQCTPMWGSCKRPAGHKGKHSTLVKRKPTQAVFEGIIYRQGKFPDSTPQEAIICRGCKQPIRFLPSGSPQCDNPNCGWNKREQIPTANERDCSNLRNLLDLLKAGSQLSEWSGGQKRDLIIENNLRIRRSVRFLTAYERYVLRRMVRLIHFLTVPKRESPRKYKPFLTKEMAIGLGITKS